MDDATPHKVSHTLFYPRWATQECCSLGGNVPLLHTNILTLYLSEQPHTKRPLHGLLQLCLLPYTIRYTIGCSAYRMHCNRTPKLQEAWSTAIMLGPICELLAGRRVILASGSPRRRQILENIVRYNVLNIGVDQILGELQ